MNESRNHEDVIRAFIGYLWRSDYHNDYIAEIMSEVIPELFDLPLPTSSESQPKVKNIE